MPCRPRFEDTTAKMRGLVSLALLAVIAIGPSTAIANKATDLGTIVYGKDFALWSSRATDERSKEPKKLAELGFAARRVTAIRSNASRRILLVSTFENHYWVDLKSVRASTPVVRYVCRGVAAMSQDGATVVCQQKTGEFFVVDPVSGKKSKSAIKGQLVGFTSSETGVVVIGENGIDSVSLTKPSKRQALWPLTPQSNLLVAPNGKRAVAVFADGDGTALYGFFLDGKDARRKLVTDAIPVAWSRDSEWLVLTRKKRGCVVRAAGGQYRCFDGYRAIGISPDHKSALLANGTRKELSIFRADLGGARSSKPSLVVKGAEGAALWLTN